MATNRKTKKSSRVYKQTVYSETRKIFVEKYLSPKGKKLILLANTKAEMEIIWNKYGKNRYKINPDAVIIGVITHTLPPR